MKKQGKKILTILLVAAAAGLFLIVGAGLLLGVIPIPGKQDFARPPCDKLPSKEMVEEAFARHGELVERLQNVGPGVKVEVVTPCIDYPNSAVIRISYKTKDEQKGISSILSHEGFGTAVELVRH